MTVVGPPVLPAGPWALAARRVVTADAARGGVAADRAVGALDDAAVVVENGRIRDVCARAELATLHPGVPVVLTASDAVVTPGLVDAHTHSAWVGSRDAEYALRMAGAGYEEIGAAGGGIVASMRALREATTDEVASALAARLRRMAALGVTTVEVKSGYGLNEATERKQLEAIAAVGADATLPRVVSTYLALHALPPEALGDRARYARAVVESWLPAIAAADLARWVDVYVDRAAFSVDDARPVLVRARALGLGVRMHVGQFADVGGARLAAEVGAASVDHVEHLGEADAARLAAAGTHAVLLPVASFTLRQEPPPIALLRAAGVGLVVASDANPGTAPTESLPLALALAVRSYGLTVPEAVLGSTSRAAASLGLASRCGMLRAGLDADLVVWDLPHENALVQPWGTAKARLVLRAGRIVASA